VQTIALAASDLGLNTLTTREFSRGELGPQEGTAGGGLWRRVLVLRLAGAVGAFAVLNVLVGPFLVGRRTLVAIVSLSLLPDAFSGLAAARIKAQQRMEVSAAIMLGTRLVYSLIGGVLLWRGYDERVLLGAYVVVSLLGAMAFGLVLQRWLQVGAGGKVATRGSRSCAGWCSVLGESMPFAITGIVSMVYTRADLLVLSFAQGDAVAGRYGMAYRLWEAMGMIPASFMDALFPELSRLGDQSLDRGRLRVLYRRGWQVVSVCAVLMSVVTQVAATPLIALVFGESADSGLAVGVFRLLLLAFPFTFLYLLNGHTLYAIGQQRRVTVAMLGVVAAKLLMDALIVPRWSTMGAAGVALASEGLLFAWLQFLVWWSLLRSSQAQGRDDLGPTSAPDGQEELGGV
jgi:O-antigen/teichoic acid export membrane protein